MKVHDLIDYENNCWRMDVLNELFYEEDIDRILAMKPSFEQDDFWVWLHNKNGSYSVKSGYWFINRKLREETIREAEMRPSLNELKASAWKIPTAPKIKTFIWRALSNVIPSGELLTKRGIRMDPVCQACGFQGESINHILFDCSIARQAWALAYVPSPLSGFDKVSHFSNLHHVIEMMGKKEIPENVRNEIPWIIWYLWKNRNSLLFEGKLIWAEDLSAKLKRKRGCGFEHRS